ncbi:MAG: flagellar assembly protein FliX [Pseudomonadota bacterium]
MISIDSKTQGIAGTTKIKKSSSKKNVKFSASKKTQESSSGEAASNVADIGGMLFLQEVDQHAEDQQNLEEFSKKAFDTLKHLQMDLLHGNIKGRHLHNLKDALKGSKFIIETPELAELAQEIDLRLQVEIAKIEINQQ